jgi:RecJ-like exonuclease
MVIARCGNSPRLPRALARCAGILAEEDRAMADEKQMKIDYDEGMRRMGLAPAREFKFATFESLLDTEDFDRFNDSFMVAREKMIEILVDYRPSDEKRRVLSSMIAYDLTKQLMDELMSTKRRMEEELLSAGAATAPAAE